MGFALTISYLFKLFSEVSKVVKTFGERWSIDDGQLIIGCTVNVALRAKTIQQLLISFQEFSDKDFNRIVKDSGRRVGDDFAADLKQELIMRKIKKIVRAGKAPDLLKEKLRLWGKYDSSTGMGIFETDQIEITIDDLRGYILLKNSFIAHDRRAEEPTCVFIEGYIEGIINRLLGAQVTVKEVECSAVNSSEYCKFEVTKKLCK